VSLSVLSTHTRTGPPVNRKISWRVPEVSCRPKFRSHAHRLSLHEGQEEDWVQWRDRKGPKVDSVIPVASYFTISMPAMSVTATRGFSMVSRWSICSPVLLFRVCSSSSLSRGYNWNKTETNSISPVLSVMFSVQFFVFRLILFHRRILAVSSRPQYLFS